MGESDYAWRCVGEIISKIKTMLKNCQDFVTLSPLLDEYVLNKYASARANINFT